mmetsp:Transcript_18953/g.45057  ORF Transcript_18953/g.45057 Transcript_18953/m.45057 type:complete len:82 (-) Transcript_18953:331-576(-)
MPSLCLAASLPALLLLLLKEFLALAEGDAVYLLKEFRGEAAWPKEFRGDAAWLKEFLGEAALPKELRGEAVRWPKELRRCM